MTTTIPDATIPNPAKEQLREKAQDLKDDLVDLAGIAKGMATDRLTALRDGAASGCKAGMERAGKARDKVVDYVQANPGTSLFACLCIGALGGFLLSRRR